LIALGGTGYAKEAPEPEPVRGILFRRTDTGFHYKALQNGQLLLDKASELNLAALVKPNILKRQTTRSTPILDVLDGELVLYRTQDKPETKSWLFDISKAGINLNGEQSLVVRYRLTPPSPDISPVITLNPPPDSGGVEHSNILKSLIFPSLSDCREKTWLDVARRELALDQDMEWKYDYRDGVVSLHKALDIPLNDAINFVLQPHEGIAPPTYTLYVDPGRGFLPRVIPSGLCQEYGDAKDGGDFMGVDCADYFAKSGFDFSKARLVGIILFFDTDLAFFKQQWPLEQLTFVDKTVHGRKSHFMNAGFFQSTALSLPLQPLDEDPDHTARRLRTIRVTMDLPPDQEVTIDEIRLYHDTIEEQMEYATAQAPPLIRAVLIHQGLVPESDRAPLFSIDSERRTILPTQAPHPSPATYSLSQVDGIFIDPLSLHIPGPVPDDVLVRVHTEDTILELGPNAVYSQSVLPKDIPHISVRYHSADGSRPTGFDPPFMQVPEAFYSFEQQLARLSLSIDGRTPLMALRSDKPFMTERWLMGSALSLGAGEHTLLPVPHELFTMPRILLAADEETFALQPRISEPEPELPVDTSLILNGRIWMAVTIASLLTLALLLRFPDRFSGARRVLGRVKALTAWLPPSIRTLGGCTIAITLTVTDNAAGAPSEMSYTFAAIAWLLTLFSLLGWQEKRLRSIPAIGERIFQSPQSRAFSVLVLLLVGVTLLRPLGLKLVPNIFTSAIFFLMVGMLYASASEQNKPEPR
jgi:hypothetical protein